MSLLARLARRSVIELTRLACLLSLLGLALMVYSVVSARPLAVILAMSVGHAVGIAAVGCFFLAVLIDAAGGRIGRKSNEPEVPTRAPQ